MTRSQSWFPGSDERAMKMKRPSRDAVGMVPRIPINGLTQTTPVSNAWNRFV